MAGVVLRPETVNAFCEERNRDENQRTASAAHFWFDQKFGTRQRQLGLLGRTGAIDQPFLNAAFPVPTSCRSYQGEFPPLTQIVWPVTKLASLLAR